MHVFQHILFVVMAYITEKRFTVVYLFITLLFFFLKDREGIDSQEFFFLANNNTLKNSCKILKIYKNLNNARTLKLYANNIQVGG